MEFYVSWSHSDALYTDYFPDSPILISALPDNRWALKRFNSKPKKLIIDCGSVFYVRQRKRPMVKDIFELQRSFIEESEQGCDITLVHFDEPMLNKKTLSERYQAMERTLFNAYEYLQLVRQSELDKSINCMGVIQGYDRESIRYSAFELKRIGYSKFGIGSLLAKGHNKQVELIQYAIEVVGASNLHVFGVTGITQMSAMIDMGVKSIDSSRPTMAAAFFQVFYSNPFRTYYLSDSRAKPTADNRISNPLPCDCPVCLNQKSEILIPSPREYMRLRSIHNYYHLVRALENMKSKRGGDGIVIPNVLRA